jgi:hypothetical protein
MVFLIRWAQSHDGIRRRCLPKLYKALDPGTDDDRMKGALWTLNVPCFCKVHLPDCSISESEKHFQLNMLYLVKLNTNFIKGLRSNSFLEPTLAPELAKKLFNCQHNEKVRVIVFATCKCSTLFSHQFKTALALWQKTVSQAFQFIISYNLVITL